MPALSARHSAMHSLAVFCVDDVLVDGDGAAGVAGVAAAGFGGGAEAAPVLHCSTYAFSVTPRPCMPALSARHSGCSLSRFSSLWPSPARVPVAARSLTVWAAGAAVVGAAPALALINVCFFR